ncbi:MAG: hypothetical protein ABS76_25430 [Pelagibacterium sp. SCN 64-44]|nr:MAG: hypothetical protein ABS76_25430 [Pelagibacterium sp. SCN 64-44]
MASISRWTLAYFGCALACLVLALGLMGAGIGYPQDGLMAPQTLIVVHLVTIGWLSLLMLGALLQFLPVLVGGSLRWARLAPPALASLLAGLALLLSGFAAIDGWPLPPELLPLGGLLLLLGLSLAAAILFATLLGARTIPLPAGFVATALLSVLVTALLGETLASAIAGLFGGDFAVAIISHGVALHAGFGLGGWLTFAAMGVSYRLISMFLVAPERYGLPARITFFGGALALALLCMGLGVLLATNAPLSLGLALAGLVGLAAIGAYLGDMVQFYRARRRRELELHMVAAVAAFVALPVGAVLLAVATAMGSEQGLAAAFHVLALGWLGGLGLAMLYKIVPFLTWLECFAPFMGRQPTPRVQDLVRERPAKTWFILYFTALAMGSAALLAGMPLAFRAASLLQLAAVALLIHEFYRARLLLDLPEAWHDHQPPRLFLPRQRSFS